MTRINYITIRRSPKGQMLDKSMNIINSEREVIVNPVNCVGVMGAGVALAIATRYPEILPNYQRQCRLGMWRPGMIYLQRLQDEGPEGILNVATKDDWRAPSQYAWIEEIIAKIPPLVYKESITSITLPPLGCGHGGLKWEVVGPMTAQLEHMQGCAIDIYIEQGMEQYHIPKYTIPTDNRPGYYRIKPILLAGCLCDVVEILKSSHLITGKFMWMPSWSGYPLFPGDVSTPESGYVYREPYCDTIYLGDEEMTNPNPPANWQSRVIEFLEDRKFNVPPKVESIPGYES